MWICYSYIEHNQSWHHILINHRENIGIHELIRTYVNAWNSLCSIKGIHIWMPKELPHEQQHSTISLISMTKDIYLNFKIMDEFNCAYMIEKDIFFDIKRKYSPRVGRNRLATPARAFVLQFYQPNFSWWVLARSQECLRANSFY